jgi:hypothetical protein
MPAEQEQDSISTVVVPSLQGVKPMGDDPMALLGLEGALKHYYYYYYCREHARCRMRIAAVLGASARLSQACVLQDMHYCCAGSISTVVMSMRAARCALLLCREQGVLAGCRRAHQGMHAQCAGCLCAPRLLTLL